MKLLFLLHNISPIIFFIIIYFQAAVTGLGGIINAITSTITCKNDANVNFCKFKSCLQAYGVNTNNILYERSTDNSSRYSELNYQWNNCCGHIDPIGYLLPRSTTDVSGGVKCAQSVRGIRIVPKGGGHSYAKYSFGDSDTIVIDLQTLTRVKINPLSQTALIGPGNLLGPLLYKLWTINDGKFSIPFGACPTVGIGFVLGGGYSEYSRLYGIGSDSLLEVRIVNAVGNVLIASKNKNSDLFWALRGGGGGSFGIVTDFKFKLFNAPERVIEGKQDYALDEFPTIFQAWQNFVSSNPSAKLNAMIRIVPFANVIALKVIELQTDAEFAEFGNTHVEAVLNGFPAAASSRSLSNWAHLDFIAHAGAEEMGGPTNINLTSADDLQYVTRRDFHPSGGLRAKTFYTKVLIGAEDINSLNEQIKACSSTILIVLRALGGAIDKLSATETAFVHRNYLYEVDILYIGSIDETETATALEWMNNFFNTTKAMMNHTESYQNHLDTGLPDYLQRYYGENLEKLVAVKRKYDAANFFHNPQSIPTAML